jgi:predicted  nucleic acid-binding Zn-ribbon protein
MRDQLEQRLKALKTELEAGEKVLADLDARRANLRDTLMRISGAIQVLEEELNKAEQPAGNGLAHGEERGTKESSGMIEQR